MLERRSFAVWSAVLLLAWSAAVGCSGGSDDSSGSDSTGDSSSEDAPQPGSPEALVIEGVSVPSLTNSMDLATTLAYVNRRFGGSEDLEWMDAYVEQAVGAVQNPDDAADEEISSDDDPEELAVYLRFLTGDAEVPEQLPEQVIDDEGVVDINALVALSLWCDEVEPPESFLSDLTAASEAGDYELTHALGATQLMLENGCGDTGEVTAVSDDLAPRAAQLLAEPGVGDLQLEACGILTWSGHRDLLPEDLAERVSDARLEGGGWPEESDGTEPDAHATVWGLRCQLELDYGEDLDPTTWVAPRP